MIASMILMLALGSVLALASQGFRYISDMRRWARSSQVLQQKMEDIRLINQWSALQGLNNTYFSDNNPTGFFYVGVIDIDPSSNPSYPTSMVARVTITVTWTNSMYKICTNRLSSVVCKNGLNKYIF